MPPQSVPPSMALDVITIGLFVAKLLVVMAILYLVIWVVTRETVLRAGYAVRLLVMAAIALLVIPAFEVLLRDFGLAGYGLALLLPFLLLLVLMRYIVVPEVSLRNEWVEAAVISILLVGVIFLMNLALGWLGFEPLVTSLLG